MDNMQDSEKEFEAMKCSNTGCGAEGLGKFCQECGSQMVDLVKTDTVVICSVRIEDGSLCQAMLVPGMKFCTQCGNKVDPSRFAVKKVFCSQCQAPLIAGMKFCGMCGHSQQSSKIENVAEKGMGDKAAEHQTVEESYMETQSSGKTVIKDIVPLTSDLLQESKPIDTNFDPDKEYVEGQTENMEEGTQNVSRSKPDENANVSSNSETEMVEDLPSKKDMNKKENTGNIIFLPPSPNNDLVEKLEHVQIQPGKTENLDIADDLLEKPKVPSSSDNVFENDVKENSEDDDSIILIDDAGQTTGNVQAKRIKKQNEQNTKKRKENQEQKNQDNAGDLNSAASNVELNSERNKESNLIIENKTGNSPYITTKTTPPSHLAEEKELEKGEILTDQSMSGQNFVFGGALKKDMQETANADQTPLPTHSRLFKIEKIANPNQHDPIKDSDVKEAGEKESAQDTSAVDIDKELDSGEDNEEIEMEDESLVRGEDDGTNQQVLTRRQKKNLKKKEREKVKEVHDKNGKEKETKNSENMDKSKNQGSKSGSSTGRSGPEKYTHIFFHGIISKDFKFNPKKDKLILVMEDENLKWDNRTRVCRIKKDTDNEFEFEFDLKIPTLRVIQGRRVSYKYCIEREDKPASEKYVWEHYLKDYKPGPQANRSLILLDKWRSTDVWHQYDGVIEKEPSTLNKFSEYFFSSWKSQLLKHAKGCIYYFCRTIVFTEDSSYAVVMEQLEMLLTCFKRIYYHDSKCWEKDIDFREEAGMCVLDVMFEAASCVQAEPSEEMREKQIASAVAAVFVAKKLELPYSNLKKWQNVCKNLILKPDPEKKVCGELKVLEKYFPEKRTQWKEGFLSLAKYISSHSKDPSWLFLMPWIHFLYELCSPYETPQEDMGHNRKTPTWWGISQLKEESVKYFRGKTGEWDIPLEETVDLLQPLFEMDYLLPRTLLTAVRLKELGTLIKTGKIPTEAILANLFSQIIFTRPRRNYYNNAFPDMSTDERQLGNIMEMLLEEMNSHVHKRAHASIHQEKMRCQISVQLLCESTKTNRGSPVTASVGIMLHCFAAYEAQENRKRSQENFMKDTMAPCIPEILKWMEIYCYNWKYYMDTILMEWNTKFSPDCIKSSPLCDEWNKQISRALLDTIQKKVYHDSWAMTDFVQLYCKKVDTFNSCMQDCLSKSAFKAIEKGYALDYGRFNEKEVERFGRLISELFMKEWRRCVTSDDIEKDIQQHFLKWPPFTQFVKIYSRDQGKMKLLSPECVEGLIRAVSVIESSAQALLNGEITVGNLRQLQEIGFADLCELINREKQHTKEFITKAIQIRKMEVDAFVRQSELITTLVNLCLHTKKVDLRAVDKVLEKKGNIEVHSVKEFCNPSDVNTVDDLEKFQPNLCAFNVSQEILNFLPELQTCSESSIFMKIWISECHNTQLATTDINEVAPKIWNTVKNRWDKMARNIKSGDIKFQEFEKILGERYRDDFHKMATELRTIGLKEQEINQRIDQLTKYRQLEACVKGAKTILKFAKDYGLKGDFKKIRLIATHGENDADMKSFDDTVMKASDFLKELTPQRELCLKMFIWCRPLVQWLKESMKKSGLKELKVFVDLAFMSAGDEPINIARVQCLHSAVTGYAPLIFDLEETSGYKDLLKHCTVVWRELEANPDLPKKLRDTNRHLQWLQEIKKAHGSVEVTSLMQAEAINDNGIFTISKHAWKKDGLKADKSLLAITDIIKLTVPEKEGKSQLRNYSFSQCQDLQSRLMLVAGKAEKGSDSVDRFTMIFDSVTRLSNVYIKLCSSGCVLFKEWTARFLCYPKPDRPVCAILEFGQGDGVPQLKGRRSHKEDLKDIIPEIAKFMETCLEDWLHHIKEKRKTYLHLNFFTVDQLVILQRELVKVGPDTEPSHLIYPLLSAVKENCTPEELIEAMAAAKEEIDGDVDMEPTEGSNSDDEDMTPAVDASDDEKRQNFMKELVEAGYDEALAIRALEFIDPEDITAGIMWCMNHEEETEMSNDVDEEPDTIEQAKTSKGVQKPVFSGWSKSDTDIQTMITTNVLGLTKQSDKGSAPLINDLTVLWKQFLESISSNIRDYLSLEHLGIILKYLAMKSTTKITRSFPPVFKEGKPNLIVCPSGDVLVTTLSVYMMDRDQPLPQSDEILMCTPNTTTDEVDIFLRRAIFDGGKKIHCLMNADLLDYDVSEESERCLDEYLLEVHHDELKYRLLVICGSDNEYRSTIVSSLDKFKRQPLPTNYAHLQEYLAIKLAVQEPTISGIKPAACVDSQRSSVRVIKSWRAGVGKSLFKQRREDELVKLNPRVVKSQTVSIPLQEKTIDLHYVIRRLLEHTAHPGEKTSMLFHIDVSHEVENGVDYLLFNLLVLGCLMDKTGFVWRKSLTDIYLIETMPLMMQATNRRGADLEYVHPMLSILPDLTCRSPVESLQIYHGHKLPDFKQSDQLFDGKQFRSPVFQRTYQYLHRLDQGNALGDIAPYNPEGTPQTCLQTLLGHCGLNDPSWSELHHFVWFLNTQLVDFENNMFVSAAAAEDLPGFSTFVLRFLIQMSMDFSTRSLDMSEESPCLKPELKGHMERMDTGDGDGDENDKQDLQTYQMRRTWESSPHPYLFFNSDRFSFSFLGFFIDQNSFDLIDQQTMTVLEKGIMTGNLYKALVRNNAPIQENFDALPRHDKITKLCNIMGVQFPHDPDDTYELTTDNVKKIMAIYMRFRCDIPVIIMGETGCGKTRLVKFMCALQVPPGVEQTNMILMKVHGGTTSQDIINKVTDAEKIAQKNKEDYGDQMYTVLFFDEANTTEAIGLIKEIMCDKSLGGEKLKLCENLKMVAACNPYRKHSDELIQKLQQAGLGYHVDAENTTDRLGRIPMRHLVYRVQPLPQSLLPLVWDFGQLNTKVEDLYIRQMVRRYIREDKLPEIPGLIEVASAILTASQDYMREQKDECSFVSLRDVDRVLTVMSWFYEGSQDERTLFDIMDDKLYNQQYSDSSSEDDLEDDEEEMPRVEVDQSEKVDDVTRSLILAIGVCYHACLKSRDQYRAKIAGYFKAPCLLPGGKDQIKDEIDCCQEVFLDNVHLEKNIARNMALKENVFMMVVCIELRIPLFLVGKPGSSKSLAKTIVSDAMQGNAAREDLFKTLKQAQMVSFQCSPLSTPDGIVGTFKQCAQFQKDKDLDTFVSIVVLDEVGLAEDSPRMPLKTLHPLLEDGCQGDEKPEKYKKVAFIGISNWALDPAKMNRGILVQREVPDLEELKNSASGICSTDDQLETLMTPLIGPMAISYLEIFEKASKSKREFYGLRDFYSLVKMVYSFVEKSKQKPTWHEMLHAIKRNFGGLDQVEPVESFRKYLTSVIHFEQQPRRTDPDCTPAGLIEACLFDTNKMQSESRYLLLLTENYGALTIIQQQILTRRNDIRPITIFGSSFRSDQEYTQVCRNINKIKVCMETGNTVVLLNLENLYESLYDALNQYYVYFGGERYVDLGLGTHRVKCPVHKMFRLIVVAEKQTVYDKFPTPLINRLEKHFLTINTMLSDEQQQVVKKLEDWAKQFVTQRNDGFLQRNKKSTKLGDVFIGFHDDTCSAIVLHVWNNRTIQDKKDRDTQVLEQAKSVLLWCATPESLIRLEKSTMPPGEQKLYKKWYFDNQTHEDLIQYLKMKILKQEEIQLFAQITTHSKLMAGVHKQDISKATGIHKANILLLETLSSFDTEQQFTNRIQQHIQNTDKDPRLMIIQCDSGDVNANLIACARYCVMDEFEKMREELRAPVHVVFIIQLPRGAAFTGFQCGLWHSAHIDDLYTEDMEMPTLQDMQGKSVAKLFTDAVQESNPMEVDEEMPRAIYGDEEMEWSENEPQREPQGDLITGMEAFEQENEYGLKEAPLQLDDVLLDLKNVDKEVGRGDGVRGPRQHKLNVKGLILACVQAALSMVKDKVENTSKETDRVSLVLNLLHQDQPEGQSSFLHGVCCLIAKLLKEKESKTHLAHTAHYWLMNEAAASENINKAGTFRRSCIQTLENKVSPILAGIIAYLDTNNNLKILQEQCDWKQELWLAYLNTSDAISLQFRDLQTPIKQSDLQEVVVMTTGCEGHMFSARMPFSWLLINQINEILKLPHPSIHTHDLDENETHSRIESSVKVLSEHPIGGVLSTITDEQATTAAVKEYIHDFVHTVYHAASGHEHELVCQSIYFITNDLENDSMDTRLLQSLLHVHVAYEKLAPRLTFFRAMNNVWPDCSEAIIELREKKPDHFMFKEQEFTFSALCLLIENLAPKGTDLNNQRGRSQWLNKVHRYRPVVEKVISMHREDPERYGAHSYQSVNRAKGLWSRVLVVKLFLEHVCASEQEDRITIKHCMPLWTILGAEANLKEIGTFSGVEKFLKSCNNKAMKEYFGEEVRCSQCESVLEGPPICLPCKDLLCDQCFDAMKALGEKECQKCHKQFEDDWEPERQKTKKDAIDKLKDYQKRCNTFFMDVVSQLCFADNIAPSQEVVNKLLGYIFFTTKGKQQRTRNLTIFDTGIDPNPVFRSFLLQLLIRTSEESVIENLQQYLEQAAVYIQQDTPDQEQHYVQLCLLVIQCLEDMFMQEANLADVDDAHYALQVLQRAVQSISDKELSVEKLYGLASSRMGLSVAAKYIADIVINNKDTKHIHRTVRKLIEAAQILCEDTKVEWTRIYFVKYLCRSYGIDVYQTICRNPAPYLRWINMKDMQREEVVEVSDRYIVCGDQYKALRESLTKVILGENQQQLKETVQELSTTGARVEPMLQLAMHREVTSSYLYPERQRKLKPQVLKTLAEFIQNCDAVRNKALMQSLIMNELAPGYLVTLEGEDLRMQGIQCLMVHYLAAMSHLNGDRTLLQPLLSLMTNPQTCVNMFLPTMPQDDLEDVKEALLAARQNNAGENPVFYRCPNGHPYVIGNCGRPATVGNCRDCGAPIGGEGYQLRPGNIQDQGGDATLTGHILGRADVRGRGPMPERTLSPVHTAVVRLLLHLSMYIGVGRNPQGIHSMIKPDIEPNGAEKFIRAHIQLDLDDIQRALGVSVDDVLLLMHSIVNNIMAMHNQGENVRADVCQLSSKKGRQQWESVFAAKFLQNIIQNVDTTLKESNQMIVEDHRLGADPLLCLLYETETNEERGNPAMLEENPRVWRYRTPISLQHLKQEVQAKIQKGRHKVLQLFLKEDLLLQALRYIPSILRLHRFLFQKYQRKLDKAEATQITIQQLKRDEVAGEETQQLLQHFAEAWELVRESLKLYLCPTEMGGMIVSKEYCNRRIDDKTPISMLLPTVKEAGLCSYALLDFLMRKQNDFLEKYLKESHRKSGNISSVPPVEVTSAHLICYDPQQDILPLVLANCQYSFEMGKGTTIDYDFAGLERQLMDRFLFSKSKIDIRGVLKIDQMVYRTEFTNAEVFTKLAEKIPQETLSAAVKTQLCGEIRSLPDLCTSLDNLDIAISFLKSTGGQPDKSLHEFMITTLQMENSICSQKAQQSCEFRHAQSLWLLLSLQKSKKMVDNNQHSESTFESVLHEFHDVLPDDVETAFEAYMKNLSIDKLSHIVDILHEYILLVVAVRQNTADEDYTDTTKNKLGEWLYGYVDNMDNPPLDVAILGDFPTEILYKHSVHTWIAAYHMLREKQTGNYRRF